MEFVKKQSLGVFITAVATLLALVSFIIYVVNGAVIGYFQGTTRASIVIMSVISILFLVGSIVIANVKIEGLVGKMLGNVGDLFRVGAVIMLIASLLLFIGDRSEGLAYIFFSDLNVLDEIQTPANMASANTAITGFVFYGLTWVVTLVGSFFKVAKKD